MIDGLLLLAIGAGLALATWNAQRTGEMFSRWGFIHRDEDALFQPSLVIRYGCSAAAAILGVIALLWLRP